jgi:hypothetical protein
MGMCFKGIVIAEGFGMFRLGAFGSGGRVIPSDNISLEEINLFGWMSRT